jgi:hypothetical protein
MKVAEKVLNSRIIGTIDIDECATNPRTYDNLTKIYAFHHRYDLGDKHNYAHQDFSSWQEFQEQLRRDHDVAFMLPLKLYDHGGLSLSVVETYPYNCPWDSMWVGYVLIDKNDVPPDITKSELFNIIQSELKTYNQYLAGDVYVVTVKDKVTGDVLESIGDVYGYDDAHKLLDELLQQAIPKQAQILISKEDIEAKIGSIDNEQWLSIIDRIEHIKGSLIETVAQHCAVKDNPSNENEWEV